MEIRLFPGKIYSDPFWMLFYSQFSVERFQLVPVERLYCNAGHTKKQSLYFLTARLDGEFTSQILAVSAACAFLCFFNLVPCLAFEVCVL